MFEQERRLDRFHRMPMISIAYHPQHEEGAGNLQQSGVSHIHWLPINFQNERGLHRGWLHQKNENVAESETPTAICRCPFFIRCTEQMLDRSLIFEGTQEVGHREDADHCGVGGHGQVANALLLHQRHGIN